MKWPKRIFKATWLVAGAFQIILLNLYYFTDSLTSQLLWWQLLTPALWLAFWLTMATLVALYWSYLVWHRKFVKEKDRHALTILRAEYQQLKAHERVSKKGYRMHRKIIEIEQRMKKRARNASGLK